MRTFPIRHALTVVLFITAITAHLYHRADIRCFRQQLAQQAAYYEAWIAYKDSVCLSRHEIGEQMAGSLTGCKDSAMILLTARAESGNFGSRVCQERNNVFGLRHDSGYIAFDHWADSYQWFMDKIYARKRSGETYREFMARVQYGSDLAYLKN